MIYGFMHIATMNHWRRVVNDQISKIKSSGLYEKTNKIYIGLVGFTDWEPKDKKFEFLFREPNFRVCENPTIHALQQTCKKELDAKVWYIHTKGVSRGIDRHCEDWRQYMEHFVVEEHRQCIKALDDGYDAAGVEWFRAQDPLFLKGHKMFNEFAHFSGNFWWANANYVAKLEPACMHDRHCAEIFIGTGSPRVKCFNNSGIDHYKKPYPRESYLKIPLL